MQKERSSKKYFAFISYSRKDLAIASKIKKEVERISGSECWMDMEGIESGDQFEDVIISAIENSKIVLFLMSDNSMSSIYSKKEVRYADSIKKKIVPINIDGSKPTGWFLFNFGGIDVIDYNNPEQNKKFFLNMKEWSKNVRKQKRTPHSMIFAKESEAFPVMHLFFLIDTSGSMYGNRMEIINKTFSDIWSIVEIMNPDVETRIAVLRYSSDIEWMYDIPVRAEEFCWIPFEAMGLTNMGQALEELDEKMTPMAYFSNEMCQGGILPSLIVLITDGEPTDDYMKNLQHLSENSYFRKAIKFAIGLGEDFSSQALVDFTGNKKKVFLFSDSIGEAVPS